MKISDHLNKAEIAYFTAKSDWQGWRVFLFNWLSIILIMIAVATWTNVVTIIAAIVLLGGRQLGLSVLMHECGHRTLFKTPWLNDFLGQWFCAFPVLNDLHSYARGHLKHHKFAGTENDPDLGNYQSYPVSKASFVRKIKRDLSGQTGMKLLAFIVKGAGDLVSREKRETAKPIVQAFAVQLAMLSLLAVFGVAWVYLLWVVAFLTIYMLVVRIRQIAEHAAVPDLFDLDPRKNTRTTIARWWERLLLAPNYVNYHLEHHFMAAVPCYRLKELRQALADRGLYRGYPCYVGYRQVLQHAVPGL